MITIYKKSGESNLNNKPIVVILHSILRPFWDGIPKMVRFIYRECYGIDNKEPFTILLRFFEALFLV